MPNKSAKIIGQALAEAGPLKPLAAFQLNDKPTSQPSQRAGGATYTQRTISQRLCRQAEQNKSDPGWSDGENWDLNDKRVREFRV